MASVGLLYVGAVLFINGLMLLGKVPGKSAAILNFAVGIMQVVFPTIILIQSNGDPAVVFGASGLYLFGFTYLYVGLNQIFDLPGEGLGWFSLFVAGVAVVFGVLQFTQVGDPLFGVIWFIWALLWTLFFLLLALGKSSLNDFTGWFTVIVAHLTGTIPALLLLSGSYTSTSLEAGIMAVLGVVAIVVAYALSRRNSGSTVPAPGELPVAPRA
ncbi:AmiS/UreI family transporter [Paeniglutamicibacter sp. R2-26]|uniref:AmiS/UreI family transporter n=1 Tax=Paeniglutamicibacter sp. R2-26 TaxID=3144417 RepID=UPI003EE6ADE1